MQTSALPLNLPSQLTQALNELDVAPQGHGQTAGGDFWLRLAAQLEGLEEVVAVLPEDVTADDLASWLAAGLGGDGLPEDGKELPLPAGLVLDPAPDVTAADHAHPLVVAMHAATAGQQAAADGSEGPGPLNGDLSLLRTRLGEVLAQLRPMPVIPTVEARWSSAAPLPIISPALLAGAQTAEGAVVPPPGVPGSADARLSDFLLAGGLPAAGAADAGSARALPEVGAMVARFAEASAQPALVTAAAATAVDSATGSQPASANSPANRVFNLDVPLQQPGWDRAFANGIRWLVNEKVQVAELRLSPPNLGPIEVRLKVEGDRTHVNIVAPHATTREAVEAALPRLREMFAESGLNLGDVNVRQDSAGRGGADGGEQPGQSSSATVGSPEDGDARDARDGPVTAQGLVDFYA